METKKPTKREKAINYFIENFNAIPQEFHGYIIFEYNKGKIPVIAVFAPRGYKTECHYSFNSEDSASAYLINKKAYIQKQYEQEQNRLKQYNEEKKGFEAGKILFSSWGCEQTNIDFYLIIDRKNDFITLQEIGEKREYKNFDDRGTTTPDVNKKIGEPFRKKISEYATVKLNSYKYGYLWDGQPKYFSTYA